MLFAGYFCLLGKKTRNKKQSVSFISGVREMSSKPLPYFSNARFSNNWIREWGEVSCFQLEWRAEEATQFTLINLLPVDEEAEKSFASSVLHRVASQEILSPLEFENTVKAQSI